MKAKKKILKKKRILISSPLLLLFPLFQYIAMPPLQNSVALPSVSDHIAEWICFYKIPDLSFSVHSDRELKAAEAREGRNGKS